MHVSDTNYLVIAVILLFATFIINPQSLLQYLITAELLWVTIYALSVRLSFFIDDSNLYGLTLYILVLSAIEMAVGLVLVTYYTVLRNSSALISPLSGYNNMYLNTNLLTNNSKLRWSVKY